jgi:hypothetical protein
MPRVEQHDLDHWRELAAYVAYTIERDEAALADLPDSVAREIGARLEWRRRELAAVRGRIDQVEADLFARDVRGDLDRL